MLHLLFFIYVNEIGLDVVVVLAVATSHELVRVLLNPGIKYVAVGFVFVVDVVSRGSRSVKDRCRCFFFVFVLVLFLLFMLEMEVVVVFIVAIVMVL